LNNRVHPILGLHHVTATVDDAQADLDFCLDTLGPRLVKKTVNFDNHFEVATVGPGFTADEDAASLGRGLKLPPWEEPHRADIEPHLPRIQC
jgi:catechol 2,3-dioxygenase-like lactoylglutathione lyase family enzyme